MRKILTSLWIFPFIGALYLFIAERTSNVQNSFPFKKTIQDLCLITLVLVVLAIVCLFWKTSEDEFNP